MTESILPAQSSAAMPNPHAQGYMYGTNVESEYAPIPTPEQATKINAEAGTPNNVTDENPSWGWTAGSGISTLHDLIIWAKALATGTLLKATTQQERLQWVPTSSSPSAVTYGLAIANFDGFIGHNGALPGYQSFMAYDLQKGATIIVLTNIYQSPAGQEPADQLAQIILKQVFAD